MIETTQADLWFFIALFPIMMIVAYNDLKYMKIRNWSVLVMIAIFIVLGYLVLPLDAYLWRFAGLLVALVAGFVLSSISMMGAGDAKFMAAAALFVAPEHALRVIIMLALLGPVALIVHRLAGSMFARKAFPDWESWQRKREFPWGLPLTATLGIYLGHSAFF